MEAVKIRLREVRKAFALRGTPLPALAGIDLEVRTGEFVCIVGPSGCGKTTLLRILAELDQPSSGSVQIVPDGTDRPPHSMVFQEHSVFPWMSVRDNVAFGLKARGYARPRRYAIADGFIAKVGLTGFTHALPHQLSGGMKQRVSLARAFANDPQVLLMDEPLAALDEQNKLLLQAELVRIWEGTAKTVLYVTHSIDEALVLGDRLMVLSARPARIMELIDLRPHFGRPRLVEAVRSTPAYAALFAHVWSQIRHEVPGA